MKNYKICCFVKIDFFFGLELVLMITYNMLNIRLKNMCTNDYLYLVHHTRKKEKKREGKILNVRCSIFKALS